MWKKGNLKCTVHIVILQCKGKIEEKYFEKHEINLFYRNYENKSNQKINLSLF